MRILTIIIALVVFSNAKEPQVKISYYVNSDHVSVHEFVPKLAPYKVCIALDNVHGGTAITCFDNKALMKRDKN